VGEVKTVIAIDIYILYLISGTVKLVLPLFLLPWWRYALLQLRPTMKRKTGLSFSAGEYWWDRNRLENEFRTT